MVKDEERIPEACRASLAYKTLLDLDAQGFRFCIWKSIDRFQEGAEGRTDLDILFDEQQKSEFFDFLRSRGWGELQAESWRSFPAVYDFVCYDPDIDALIHIHAHAQLVVGEPRLKSFTLPFAELYLSRTEKIAGLPCVVPELEMIIFLLRVALKTGWRNHLEILFPFLKPYFLRPYKREFTYLKSRVQKEAFQSLLNESFFDCLPRSLILSGFESLENFTGKHRNKVWNALASFSRYGSRERVKERIRKWFLRRIEGSGKTLPNGGMSFAFCGADGSGKTTLLKALLPILGSHIKVRRVYLGGSPASKQFPRKLFRTILFLPFAVTRRIVKQVSVRGEERLATYFYACEARLITSEQLRRYRWARRRIGVGEIVLFERYPLFPGAGDRGTSDLSGDTSEEGDPYAEVTPPDRVYLFDITFEASKERKHYHDWSELERKVRSFKEFMENHESPWRVERVDALASVRTNKQQVMKSIFRAMSQ